MSESTPGQQLQEIEEAVTQEPADVSVEEEPTWLPRQLTAFRHRNYRLFFSGQMISLTGLWLQQVAHGWLVLQLTNSALLLGVVASIGALPALVFSLPAGVAADRFNKRNLIVATQCSAMVLALALAALVHWQIVTVYHIVAVGFLLGTVHAFDAPTRQSFVIEMVGRRDLMNAIALNSATFNSARIIGPAVAGVVIAAVGIAGAFFINGVSYLAVILCLLLMRTDGAVPAAGTSVLEGLKEVYRFVRGHRMVGALLGVTAVVSMFSMPYMVLMPIFARDILKVGPGGLGYLMSSAGVGALLGALVISSLGDYRAKGKLLLVGNLTFCAVLIVFSFSRLMSLSMGLLVGVGWGFMTNMALTNTLLQTCVPDRLRGRVMSAYTLMFFGMAPLGSLQAGVVANWLGAPAAVRIGAILCGAVVLLLSPRFIHGGQAD